MYKGFNPEKEVTLSKYQIFQIKTNKNLIKGLVEIHRFSLSEESWNALTHEYLISYYMKISPIECMFTTFFDYYLRYLKVIKFKETNIINEIITYLDGINILTYTLQKSNQIS